MDSAALDAEENFGFLIRYLPEGTISRSSTYSIRNKTANHPSTASSSDFDPVTNTQFLAFKAVRKDLIRDLEVRTSEIRISSRLQVDLMVEQLRQACEDIGATSESDDTFVIDEAIVSLAEARRSAGLLDRLNYEMKVRVGS